LSCCVRLREWHSRVSSRRGVSDGSRRLALAASHPEPRDLWAVKHRRPDGQLQGLAPAASRSRQL
ncbi:MAG: hypothetical protein ACK55Z_28695, partial [bacterium]